jgi:hypothetical protein
VKPILIGMNNPLSMDSKYALYPLPKGSAGGHLWQMLWEEARVTPRQYINAFERMNLLVGECPGSSPAPRKQVNRSSWGPGSASIWAPVPWSVACWRTYTQILRKI